MNLVVVESPAKAKTINKYLGDNYIVLASYGHIRDLPSKNGSVDPENDFKMEWEVDSFSKKYLKEITDAAKISSKIILATDPDREGEAIAWHVKEYLNEKKLIKDKHIERVVFNEITKKAFFVISLKTTLSICLSLINFFSFKYSLTCQAIASPSLSGSVANMIFDEILAASVISLRYFLEKLSTSHSILKSFSGSTEPFFEGRSLI